ncbi:exocyst subunit SEC8 ASCRUDRAFT_20420, partial [Ascoidea rubescens DSM 1968]
RTLSTSQYSDLEKNKMQQSLANLQLVYNEVERDWSAATQEDSNPLELALPLLDTTSVGLASKYPLFTSLYAKIGLSLQNAVDEHFQAFNSSVGSYSTVLEYINDSQETVKAIKENLKQSTAEITDKKDYLNDLNLNSQKYANMIEILDVIEILKNIPEQLENYFVEKNFSKVENLLSYAEQQANSYNLWNIEALAGIKSYLESQRISLFDTIMEELYATIYLKSASYSSSSSSNNQFLLSTNNGFSTLEQYIHNIINIDISERSSNIHSNLEIFLKEWEKSSKLNHLSPSYSYKKDQQMDPYNYIKSLLETLAKLDKLPKALETLTQRNPFELHKLVNHSAEEIRLKHPKNLKETASFNKLDFNQVDFGLGIGDLGVIVLQDYFWNVFTKFLLVLQSHRVVYEISKHILTSNSTASLLNYDFIDIWKNMENESRSLIYSYITDDSVVFSNSHLKNPSHSASKQPFQNNLNLLTERKNNNTTLFHLNDSKLNDSIIIKESEELKSVLQEIFPGFVMSNEKIQDKPLYLEDESYSLQETLVPSNVFNMRVILESFLVFIQGAKNTFPLELKNESNDPIEFFKEFMLKTFLPQLDDSFEYINMNQNDLDNDIKFNGISNSKIFKSADDFYHLFTRICRILNTNLEYRNEYGQIILLILNKFLNKYQRLYDELITKEEFTTDKKIKMTTQWMKFPQLSHISLQILKNDVDKSMIAAEIDILLDKPNLIFENISKSQLLPKKSFNLLSQMLGSISWILMWLLKIRKVISKEEIEKKRNEKNNEDDLVELRNKWLILEGGDTRISEKYEELYLTLEEGESAGLFDKIIEDFKILSRNTLLGLRYDMRLRTMYQLNLAFRNDYWTPESDMIEVVKDIELLNEIIVDYNNKLINVLGCKDRDGILVGLPDFIDRLAILNGSIISKINLNGIKKLNLNIMAIQQVLRNILHKAEDVDFSYSIGYYSLFRKGQNNLIQEIKENKNLFNINENKVMIRLMYSEE